MRHCKLLASVLLIWSLMCSCSDDTSSVIIPDGNGEKEGTVTLTLRVPGAETVSTKVMSDLEECEVESIDVLVFNNMGDGNQDKFLYHEAGVDIEEVSGQPTQRKFSMKIRQTIDPNNVYLMVLANVSGVVEGLLDSGEIAEGMDVNAVISKLVFELPYDQTSADEGGKWLVKPGRYTRFPMWGKSEPVDLTQPIISVDPVWLLRACAKIDIGLNFNSSGVAQGLSDFFLEEFHLYNAYNSLKIAPSLSNYDASAKKVTALSLPSGVTTFNPNRAISYYRREYRGDAGYNDFLNEIYLAEHETFGEISREENVAIVVGGRYGSKTAAITYYRIDLVQHDNGLSYTNWLDVLRNHRYRINITKVKERGYDTKEEAFAAMGMNTNLEIDIEEKDENITEIVYDGQYYLGVNKTAVTLDKNGVQFATSPRQIYVGTNYEAGWKASTSASWIKFVQDNGTTASTYTYGSAGNGYNLKFVAEANTSNANRQGTITIQAGRLFQDIVITQTTVSDIEISGISLLYAMNATNQTFQVKSTFDWSARVVDDEYNVIASFDKSGLASPNAYVTFNFSGINELVMDALPVDQKNRVVTFEFYSPTGEFDAYRQAINIGCYYVIGSYDVYVIDQPTGSQWYIYANATANNAYSSGDALPGTSGQSATPHTNSCAALNKLKGGAWHLPTQAQANVIKNTITTATYTQYGMVNAYYWLATSASANYAYLWNPSNGPVATTTKTYASYRARCVRVR